MSTPYERQLLQPVTFTNDETLIGWGQIVYVDCSIQNKDITITLPWSQASTPTGEEVNQTFGYVHVIKTDNTPFKVFVEPFTNDKLNGITNPIQLNNQWDFVQAYNDNTINEVIINTNYNLQKLFTAVNNNIATLQTTGQVKDSGKKFSIDGTLSSNSDNNIPTEKAIKTYVDSSVAGLLDYRGGYDASSNQYPSTGGSGTGGAILKGDAWSVTVNGVINSQPVKVGDMIIAKVDTPNQTATNWDILAVSIYNNSITNALLDKAPQNTYKGNNTGATANVSDIPTNTAFNQSFETSTANIKMNNAVSVGSSNNIARSDHVHPSDTTKQNLIATATNNNIVTTDATGQTKDSGKKFSTDVSLSGNSDNNVSTESVVKYNIDYVNNRINNLPIGAGIGSAYYFTNDVNGSYLTLSATPKNGTQAQLQTTVNNNTSLLGSFATTTALNRTIIDAGIWEFNLWVLSDSTQANTNVYAEVYKLSSTNVETLLFTLNNSNNIGSTTVIQYSISGTQPSYTILATDKLLIKLYAKTTRTQNTIVTVYYNSEQYYSHAHTPLVTYHNNLAGIQGGNGNDQNYHLTQTQYNNVINQASATQNGYLSSTDFTTFNNKQTSVLTNANILVGNASNVATSVLISGDGTLDNTGKITVTKTNNVAFASSATTDTTNANNISSGTLPNARLVSVPNSALANSSITIAGQTTALGGAVTQDQITGLNTTGLIKRTGANALAVAVAKTDYLPATTGNAIQKADNSGGLTGATVGTDYSAGTSALATGILKSTTTTGALSIATVTDLPFTYNNTYYVSSNGLDTNDGKTPNTPVLTLGKAIALAGNVGVQIVVYPGTYAETLTITALNLTITSPNREQSGIVNFTGTLTFAHTTSSIRLSGLNINSVVHSNAGSLYLERTSVNTSLSKTGGGYLEVTSSDSQGSTLTGTISITGAGSVLFINRCNIGAMTINNATAVVTISNNINAFPITLLSGVLGINDTPIYAASGATNAISVSTGAICYITNSTILVYNTLNTWAKINIASGAFYSLNNVIYDNANSTIAGTLLSRTAYFDLMTANNLISNITSTASSGTGIVLTVSSNQIQRITGTLAQIITMPNATTLQRGHSFIFYNESTGSVTINNNGASLITTILTNTDSTVTLVDNSTANGVWHVSASSSAGSNSITNTYSITHSFTTADIGKAVYYNGTALVLAKADNGDTLATELIFSVPNSNSITTITTGVITLANWTNVIGTTNLTSGQFYLVSTTTAGQLTATNPTSGYSNPILKAISTTQGIIYQYRPSIIDITTVPKGYMIASLTVAQDTNIATGQLIKLDSQKVLLGNTISFNTATYIATLTQGRNYRITGIVTYCDPATLNNPHLQYSIKVTNSTPASNIGGTYAAASSDANAANVIATAIIINANANTTVQLEQTKWVSSVCQRIGAVNTNIYTDITKSYPALIIEEL